MAKGKNNMRIFTLYSVVGVFVLLVGGFGAVVYQAKQSEAELAAKEVPPTQFSKPITKTETQTSTTTKELPAPESIYPNTKAMFIGSVEVQASVAQTWPERIEGLSNTPYLPESIVKLFIFDSSGFHSFWMKDMNYSIDILWVDEAEVIVHIEENASPASYPAMFVPKSEARYVVETTAGFVEKNGIKLGDRVVLPTL